MSIKPYQKCYKIRKGFGNVPQKITITEINGDEVDFVWGHYEKDELESRLGLMVCTCKAEKILENISEKQKSILENEDKKFDGLVEIAEKELRRLKNS